MNRTCKHCGRSLPEEQFELYPSGTRRGVCRHCHYLLHGQSATYRWRMKQKAALIMNRRK